MPLLHAYFLHTRPYRETSLLVDVFTAEAGMVSGIMRGGRGSRRPSPQLFQPLHIELAGKSELKTLRQLELAGNAVTLQGASLFSAFYANELLVRLLPRDEVQSSLFLAYAELLGNLALPQEPAVLLRRFETALLEVLGYAIDFTYDGAAGEAVKSEAYYAFHPEQGFYATTSSQAIATGRVLLSLAEGCFEGVEEARIAKQINRLALARLLGNRPLRSRELFLSSRS